MSVGRSNLLRQTLHTFGTLVFGVGVSFVAGIAVARAFGPAGKGVVSLAGILLFFAAIVAGGLKQAVAHQFGTLGRSLREAFGASLSLAVVVGLAGSLVLAVLAVVGPHGARLAYGIAAVAFPFGVVLHSLSVFYQLRDRIELVNTKLMLTVGGGASIATLLAVVVFHAGLGVVLGILVGSFVLGTVVNFWGLRRLLGGPPVFAGRRCVQEQASFGGRAALGSVVTLLAQRVDIFVVSAFAGPIALGVYTLAISSGELMWQVSRSLCWSSAGRIASASRDEAIAMTARIVRLLIGAQVAIGIVLFVGGPWLIELVYGPKFAGAGTVLRVLLPGIVLYSADETVGYFLSIRDGRPGFVLRAELVNLGVCALLAVILVPRIGLVGAAVATTVAYVVAFAIKAIAFTRSGELSFADLFVPRYSDIPLAIRRRLNGRLREASAG